MKIVLHDYHGTPHHFDLSKEFAKRGADVLHVYSATCGGPKADFDTRDIDHLKVFGIRGREIPKDRFFKRYIEERQYGIKITKVLENYNPDIIISANTPTDAEKKIVSFAAKKKIPFIFWLKDIRSLAVFSVLSDRFGFLGQMVGKYYMWIEKKLLQKSDHIISLTDDFLEILKTWKVNTKISVIPDWTPIDDFPLCTKENSFSLSHNLSNKFVILYSGTLGLKHNPELISEAAEKYKEKEDNIFLVISEGVGIEFLKKEKKKKKLDNLMLLPFQPYNELSKVLASADLLLTILEPSASQYCVPSKVWTGFCAAKPSVLVVPEENLAARVTKEINAGIVVSDQNSEALINAIEKLKNNSNERSRMGVNARRYAEKNFHVADIAHKFEEIIKELA